jgi:hypothetical protein
MQVFLRLALCAAALTAATAPAVAATVVNTGTPAGNTQWTLNPSQSLAGRFTVAAPTVLRNIYGYIKGYSAATTGTISIYSDGPVPSAANLLFSSTVALSANVEGWQGVTNRNWAVGSGNYWVGFASNGLNSMRNQAPAPLGNYAFTSANGNWNQFNGLRFGVQIDDTIPSLGGVPEPMSWALMILGFGVIGGALRRRGAMTRTAFA